MTNLDAPVDCFDSGVLGHVWMNTNKMICCGVCAPEFGYKILLTSHESYNVVTPYFASKHKPKPVMTPFISYTVTRNVKTSLSCDLLTTDLFAS